MKKRFIVTQGFKSPYMLITGQAHRPHKIEYKSFRKGETIIGKVHYRGGKPAFVMIDETLVVPLNVIKEVLTKDVVSNATGDNSEVKKEEKITVNSTKISKQKYVLAAIGGALIGFGVNIYAQKKGWLVPNEKNKFIAMAIGGASAAYLLYLCTPSPKVKDTVIKQNL